MTYGNAPLYKDFTCSLRSVTDTQIQCQTAVGTGSNLAFIVTVGGQVCPS